MGHPGLEQLRHEERQPVENPRGPRGGIRVARVATLDDAFDQRRRSRLEDAIELAHARAPRRTAVFQCLGELHHRDGLLDEAEPRQACGQPLQQPLPTAGPHDPVWAAATGERHVEDGLADKAFADHLHAGRRVARVAPHQGREQPADAAASRRGRARCAEVEPGREQPERFAGLHRGLDQPLGRRVALPSEAIELGGRHARRWFLVADRDERGGTNHRSAQPADGVPPADDRVELLGDRLRPGGGISGAPGRHGLAEQPEHAPQKLGRILDRCQTIERRAARAVDVDHAAIHPVVGGVAPHHRFVGRCHPFFCIGLIEVVFVTAAMCPAAADVGGHSRRRDDVDHAAGVGFDHLQKAPNPGSSGGRAVGACLADPAGGGGQPCRTAAVDGRPLQQRDPVNEQPRSPFEITLVEERVGSLRVTAGRREGGHFPSPESGGGRLSGHLPPPLERGDHVAGRVNALTAREVRHVGDGGRREAVPPRRE